MNLSVDSQMLLALEYFHYANRFRGHRFLLTFEDAEDLERSTTDIRVLYDAGIKLMIATKAQKDLSGHLIKWEQRGYPFFEVSLGENHSLPQKIKEELVGSSAAKTIPVIFLPDTMGPEDSGADDFVLDLACEIQADKVFFLTKSNGLMVDGTFHSHITPEKLKSAIAAAQKINQDKQRLVVLAERCLKDCHEIVLIEAVAGNLFKEVFTHKGKGTLLTQEYPNEIRPGRPTDLFDLRLLMKPYVQSGAILPITEDEMAEDIESYFVYTVNSKIVASAKLNDYGEMSELAKFCTLPRYQGKGRAKELALKLIEKTKEQNKKGVFALSVHPKMWDFFTDLGFQPCQRQSLPASWRDRYDMKRKSKAFIFIHQP